MTIPYYGEIEVDGQPFCEGCKEADLTIITDRLYGNGECVITLPVLKCSQLKTCAHLNEVMEFRKNERR